MTPAGIPAIAYLRVSTKQQGDSGLGLEAQEAAIRDVCNARGWLLTRTFTEVESSRKARPILEQAMQAAREAGGVLVVAKDDRVSRSTIETLMLYERAAREGWHFFAANIPNVVTTTPEGKFMATIFAAFAELERERIRERTRAAMRAKIARGEPVGRPRATDAGDPDDPADEARRQQARAALRRLGELRAGGMSYERIAEKLNQEGVPGLQGGRWHKRSTRLACLRYGVSGPKQSPGRKSQGRTV